MPRVKHEEFYGSALQSHGPTAEGLQWASEETQRIRFRVLRTLLPEDLSELTLVDAGCGFGDFLDYLRTRGQTPGAYIGLDVMAPMVEMARARVGGDIRLCDVLADPLPEADYYLCSGAMNTLTAEETQRFIANCLAASRQGFIFNLLKGRDRSTIYNCRQPAEIRTLAAELGADCRIEEGYLSNDFSVRLLR
ncbi:MAG: class I SAM-dependent methyltransferase [Chromatiaceae bacterium]|nr:class I SAM-dependent methyltransferase [Chromatiaceae bacterium]